MQARAFRIDYVLLALLSLVFYPFSMFNWSVLWSRKVYRLCLACRVLCNICEPCRLHDCVSIYDAKCSFMKDTCDTWIMFCQIVKEICHAIFQYWKAISLIYYDFGKISIDIILKVIILKKRYEEILEHWSQRKVIDLGWNSKKFLSRTKCFSRKSFTNARMN